MPKNEVGMPSNTSLLLVAVNSCIRWSWALQIIIKFGRVVITLLQDVRLEY